MSWLCVTENCKVVNGVWDLNGIAYYSIAEDILVLHDAIFNYFQTLTANTYMFMFFCLALTTVVALILGIKLKVMRYSFG